LDLWHHRHHWRGPSARRTNEVEDAAERLRDFLKPSAASRTIVDPQRIVHRLDNPFMEVTMKTMKLRPLTAADLRLAVGGMDGDAIIIGAAPQPGATAADQPPLVPITFPDSSKGLLF
jgi:hypothetical protein